MAIEKKPRKTKKIKDKDGALGNRLRDIPAWLEDFSENIAEKSFRHPWTHPQVLLKNQKQQRRKKWNLENTVFIITSRRTEIAKYAREPRSQGRLAGNALGKATLRAESFGDFMTANHKVLNEGRASHHNHRYAVVVLDLATR